MILNIGDILVTQRKRKQITQQELADFIGVTKASVSKWENGQTYPDITLLPLLAAYFDLSIDDLLSYHSQLTSKEIQNIYRSLQKSLGKSRIATVESLQNFLKRYYSCYPFILQMGIFLLNHGDKLLEEDSEERKQVHVSRAKELFERVVNYSNDSKLVDEAIILAAYCSLLLGNSEEVLSLLGKETPPVIPIEPLIAGAYQQKGEINAAVRVSQSGVFQYIVILMSMLTNYLQLLIDQPEKFEETVKRGSKLGQAFNLETLHPINWLNFLTSSAVGFAAMGKEQQLFQLLELFAESLTKVSFPIVLHGDTYFDQIDDWIRQLELGNQPPRETTLIRQDFIDLLETHPSLQSYKADSRMQKILQKIQLRKEDLNE